MTAAKWPSHPTPAPLLAISGTLFLAPHALAGWSDLVGQQPTPPRGTSMGGLPLPLSWDPGWDRQGAPFGPLHFPGPAAQREENVAPHPLPATGLLALA